MYQAYWGLQTAAFTAAAARKSLAASPVHAEALARLDFLCDSGCSFGLLIGAAGSGKSTVLTAFASQAVRRGKLVALANAAASDELALLTSLATGLQVQVGASAGRIQPAFTTDGARRLFELSGGAPRKVNQLAQLALLAGAAQSLVQIDAETIQAVDEELTAAR